MVTAAEGIQRFDEEVKEALNMFSQHSPPHDAVDTSATTLVSVRNPRVFQMAVTALTEPRAL